MANTKITADNLAANAVTSASIADNSIGITQLNVSDGTNGQVLTTNGSGTLSFSTISGYTDSDVETYLNTSTIYTDPTNNRLGIGTASPATTLAVNGATQILAGNALYFQNSAADANGTISGSGGAGENTLSFNSGAMVLNASGNVGIGTSSNISSPLTIQTNGSASALSIIGRNNGTSDEAVISFYEYDGTTRNSYIIKEAGDLAFATGTGGSPSERIRIESDGKIKISNNIPMWSGAYGGALVLKGDNATSNRYAQLSIVDSNGTLLYDGLIVNNTGTVAINTTSPSSTPLHVNSFSGNTLTAVFEAPASNNFDVQFRSHSYYGGISFYSDFYGSNTKYGQINQYINGGMYYTSTNGGHVFVCNTNNSVNETMRLNGPDGVLLVNRSSRFGAGGSDAMIVTGGTDAAIRVTGPNTSTYKWIEFYNGSLNQIGSISNNSNTNTSFNTSSDYRLKENINDVWEATPLLKQLRPVQFNWIADETDEMHHGFIAHEVDAILPFTVTGEKDAMTEPVYYVEADQEVMEGTAEAGDLKEEAKIQPQQMDYAKVVPLLVKTIQELEARIETLENA